MSRSSNDSVSGRDRRVGLIFDERMYKHYAPHEKDHVECPDRIWVIWDLLNSSGLAKRCIILKAKAAEDNHLALVHTKNHITLIKNISSKNTKSKRTKIAENFDSIYFNEGSTEAACLAAGSVIEAAEKVAKGEIDSAFAIVRPPGHHAEEGQPMGFCLYNNVAIAASYLLNERQELGINKILIVDWDVHHGNGTQNMFYKDPRVLVFSVHRHDFGTFYPTGDGGSYIMTGEGAGAGHNINVPWEHGQCGDADYLAVWDHILIPVAKEFEPDMIIISAGFDAAKGDPLGGCCVSPNGYSIMLDKLMEFAGGKIVMALEGGYNLNSTASSARACVEVLLHDKSPNVVSEAHPFASTWRVIQDVGRVLRPYWAVLARIDIRPLQLKKQGKRRTEATGKGKAQKASRKPAEGKGKDARSPKSASEDKGSSYDQVFIDITQFGTNVGSELNLTALAEEKKRTTLERLASLMSEQRPEPSIAKETSTLSLAEPSVTEPLSKRLKSKASTTQRVLTYSPEISSPTTQPTTSQTDQPTSLPTDQPTSSPFKQISPPHSDEDRLPLTRLVIIPKPARIALLYSPDKPYDNPPSLENPPSACRMEQPQSSDNPLSVDPIQQILPETVLQSPTPNDQIMPTLPPRQPSPPQQTPAHISALISPEAPISQEKQFDNIEQPVLHSDQATSPHVSKKGPEKKNCCDAQDPSEPGAKNSQPSLSPASQKGSQIKIQLPGSLLKLTPAGSWAFIRSLASSQDLAKLTPAECWAILDALTSSEDVAMLRELSTEQLVDMICFNLVEQIILVSEVGSKLESCEEKDAVLKELKSELKEKDVELMKTRNLNAKLEAENRELQQRLANAEKEKEVLRMKARAEGKEEGIKLCRERILMALDRPF